MKSIETSGLLVFHEEFVKDSHLLGVIVRNALTTQTRPFSWSFITTNRCAGDRYHEGVPGTIAHPRSFQLARAIVTGTICPFPSMDEAISNTPRTRFDMTFIDKRDAGQRVEYSTRTKTQEECVVSHSCWRMSVTVTGSVQMTSATARQASRRMMSGLRCTNNLSSHNSPSSTGLLSACGAG